MSVVHTTILDSIHSYTRSHTPWVLDENRLAKGQTSTGCKFGWRLFHYISGGGMQAFGRSVRQEEIDLKRNRFLIGAGVFAFVWLMLWIF
ncbi:MAG: hypothetical protein II823_05480 [Kiritimatiellae bacterium]|nr:hypothetical protein [Kiritimatiellia bacterium]